MPLVAIVALCATSSTHAQAPRATLEDTATCMEQAAHRTDLLVGQQQRLCFATPSPSAPIDCYLEATQTLLLTDPQAVELCRCSATVQPARCVHDLRREARLTDPELVAMCAPTTTLGLRADCTPIP
jgi:hypothetical protein